MHRVILALFFTATALTAQPSADAVKKELNAFQGTWTLVSGQNSDGKVFAAEEFKDVSLVVDGDKFFLKEKGKVSIEGTFTVDPTKKLKTIDVNYKNPNGRLLGIYQIDGDTRKSCFAEDGKTRPDGFRKEKGFMLFEWKRAK